MEEARPYNTKYPFKMVVNEDAYQSMVRHRTCWVAHFEIWSPLLPTLSTSQFVESLPCKADRTSCPYSEDMEARVRGEDPGPICPIYTGDSQYIALRESQTGSSKVLDLYTRLFEEV